MGERGDSSSGTTTRLLQTAAEDDGNSDRKSSERPREPWKGEYVKSIVFAGLDAIITCFSLISSISASTRSSGIYMSVFLLTVIRVFDILVKF